MNQLIEGSPVQVPGKRYIMRNVGGIYDCSCVAWKMQSRQIDIRTCKHLCAHLGVENERARVGNENMPTKHKLKTGTPRVTPAVVPPTPPGMIHTYGGPIPATAHPANAPAPVVKKSLPCLLADRYEGQDPTGWWMSEKLDGVRAIWDGADFRTRNNNILHAPDWFKQGMPKGRLDGELWLARDEFQKTMSIVRRLNPNGEWKSIKYLIFDAPDAPGSFEARLAHLKSLALPSHVVIVPQIKCTGKDDLEQYLDTIVQQDGEGVMLRKPGSLYEKRRSSTLLKVKPYRDMEVVVTGHTAGKGKHKGVVGALTCELDGKSFNVGGGLTDAERVNPPAAGTIITIQYLGFTKAGIPRHASFVRPYVEV